MPTSNPNSPKLVKGALVAYRSSSPGTKQHPDVITFQYNPAELSRSLQHRGRTEQMRRERGRAVEDVRRREGPPVESIDLTIELDAADQAEFFGQRALDVRSVGLHPSLAALELLLYPKATEELEAFEQGQSAESVKVAYAEEEVPLVLFVWGKSRVLPVQLTNLSITEQAFDSNLNPVHASADVSMDVLTYEALEEGIGRRAYLTTHSEKLRLARTRYSSTTENIPGLRRVQ